MRGVVTLAAALALPLDFPGRDAILFASFVVILFTVLVQGVTLGPLIRLLRVTAQVTASADVLDLNTARLAVAEAGLASLEAIVVSESGEVVHPRLIDGYRRRVRAMSRFRDEGATLEMERSDHFAARPRRGRERTRRADPAAPRTARSTIPCCARSRASSISKSCA